MRNKLIINTATIILVVNLYGRTILSNIPFINLLDDALMILLVLCLPFSNFTNKALLRKPFFVLLSILIFSAVLNEVAFDIFLVQIRSLFMPMILIHYLLIGTNKAFGFALLKRILLVSIPVILIGLLEYIYGRLFFESFNRWGESIYNAEIFRVASTIGNPIDLGLYMMLISGILFIDLFYRLNLLNNKLLTWIMFIGSVLVVFVTKSRGPILATMAMLVYFLILNRLKLKYLLATVSITIIFYLSFGKQLLERFSFLNLDLSSSDDYRNMVIEVFTNHQ